MAKRSVWKIPFVSPFFLRRGTTFYESSSFNTWIRSSSISPYFIDKRFRVYNGSKQISFVVSKDMIGKKFGEFSISKVTGSDIIVSKRLKAKKKKKEKSAKSKKKKINVK